MRRKRNTEMKFTVLSSLLLGCLFVITVQGTSARFVSGQKVNKNKVDLTEIIAAQKELFERTGAAHVRKLGFGAIHHEETSVDSEKSISGASYSDGICDFERKGDKIVKCKGEKSIKPTRKLKMDGFVDFTDDYHGPRHHLPKHN